MAVKKDTLKLDWLGFKTEGTGWGILPIFILGLIGLICIP
jgi:hypothetical protein